MARQRLTPPRPGLRTERLALLFVLGLLVFNPPVLAIFDVPDSILGIPLLYLYLFAAWAGLILLSALASEGAVSADDQDVPPPTGPQPTRLED